MWHSFRLQENAVCKNKIFKRKTNRSVYTIEKRTEFLILSYARQGRRRIKKHKPGTNDTEHVTDEKNEDEVFELVPARNTRNFQILWILTHNLTFLIAFSMLFGLSISSFMRNTCELSEY